MSRFQPSDRNSNGGAAAAERLVSFEKTSKHCRRCEKEEVPTNYINIRTPVSTNLTVRGFDFSGMSHHYCFYLRGNDRRNTNINAQNEWQPGGGRETDENRSYLGARTDRWTPPRYRRRSGREEEEKRLAVSGLVIERHCDRQPRGEFGLNHREARRGGVSSPPLFRRERTPRRRSTRWHVSITCSAD